MFRKRNKYMTQGIFEPKIQQEIYFTKFDNGSIFIDRELTMRDFSKKLRNLEKGLINNNSYGEA
tara:strand:+ start:152 stop:343 length:192 start_codon:yes stop_codon:yes gene_type:complete